jgi:chromatin remodeling complex protein RSC6
MAEKPKTNGLQKPMTPSAELVAVIGAGQVARSDAVKKMWDYIKAHNLQNPANKREILADAKLKPVFGGKDKVTMFEMNSHLAKHLT